MCYVAAAENEPRNRWENDGEFGDLCRCGTPDDQVQRREFNMFQRFFTIFGLALLLLTLTGCGSKISKSNYDKIKDGMTLAEVEETLGKGSEQASSNTGGPVEVPGMSAGGVSVPGQTVNMPKMSGKAMVWQEGGKVISITFINDKAMGKAQTGL